MRRCWRRWSRSLRRPDRAFARHRVAALGGYDTTAMGRVLAEMSVGQGRPSQFTIGSSQSKSESCTGPFINGFTEAMRLVFSGDPGIGGDRRAVAPRLRHRAVRNQHNHWDPARRSAGAGRGFHGKQPVVATVYTGMAFPPVVVGLFVYLLLSRAAACWAA